MRTFLCFHLAWHRPQHLRPAAWCPGAGMRTTPVLRVDGKAGFLQQVRARIVAADLRGEVQRAAPAGVSDACCSTAVKCCKSCLPSVKACGQTLLCDLVTQIVSAKTLLRS